ncbi:GAF domain-containing protein [Pelagibacterium flavum]|uniref:GAF domain-containing protein n=1 Tax=Pelagibacterium flavum TaxID=2984530 RepID=A0ABY6IWT4_9HYPH|nr:GAF domain-containing protein [Pelagibacterium sp. YIM 151497]MAN78212.1 GAF domain-containing protein [Hyphomicrobiales bacterium]UYQ73869.1 GAF domain-containing protein [Pelagibacterium sp. YIM 151497]|tara:strand:+ start:4769 stop:5278 length:510 start_codon:yes stop_codon:yes gene_type:complete
MTPPSAQAQLDAFDTVAKALAEGDRHHLYEAVEDALQTLVGHKLFTLLMVLPGAKEVQRFYSTNVEAYPLTGKKTMGDTPWGDLVIRQHKPFLGRNRADIEWAFFDHELIASLGLGSAINVPVIRHGELLGTLALLHAEGHFDDAKLAIASRFAPYLVDAFATEIEAAQ